MRILEDRRAVPLVVALGWAAFYATVAASNATEILNALGVAVRWRSGNVDWVRSTLELVGRPQGLAVAIVAGAALVEGLSTALYLRAARSIALDSPAAAAALRAASVPGLLLWFSFVAGVELFLAYEKVDWSKFVVLIIGILASLAATERVLGRGPEATSPGGT